MSTPWRLLRTHPGVPMSRLRFAAWLGSLLLILALMVGIALLLAGCSSVLTPVNPIPGIVASLPPIVIYDGTRESRNAIVERTILAIDVSYQEWVDALNANRSAFDSATDFTAMGLSATATIVNGEAAKTLLAGIATVVMGARAVVDKNLFYDATIQVLIAQMDQQRLARRADLTQALALTVDQYPLERAVGDLLLYWRAGTLLEAANVMTGEVQIRMQTTQRCYRRALALPEQP